MSSSRRCRSSSRRRSSCRPRSFSFFVRNTAFAITNEQSRFTLSGAKFIVGDGKAKMITTDGHRLAYVERAIDCRRHDGHAYSQKGPARAGQDSAAARAMSHLARTRTTSYFETEGRLLITRKLTGTFPNYEMVMPKNNDHVGDLRSRRDA